MKKILVCGAGGFIGGHLVGRLLREGHNVVGVDIKPMAEWHQRFQKSRNLSHFDITNDFLIRDLITSGDFDEIYQLAADMGGAGYIFSKNHDADIMNNSATINLTLLKVVSALDRKPKIFYSSSACIYPESIQGDPNNPGLKEVDAYPANPDSEYGWEKLFSERLYRSYARNYDIPVRIARFHNIYGPYGSWNCGKEKAPAAMCRKVAEAEDYGEIEIWGDGKQTRSFLYVEDCLDAVLCLMDSTCEEVLNIGSEEMVSINDLVKVVSQCANKSVIIKHIEGPLGVRGRNSNNDLIRNILGWEPKYSLTQGIMNTYPWISKNVDEVKNSKN